MTTLSNCESCGDEYPDPLLTTFKNKKLCGRCCLEHRIMPPLGTKIDLIDPKREDLAHPECTECKSRNTIMVVTSKLSSDKRPWIPYLCRDCHHRFLMRFEKLKLCSNILIKINKAEIKLKCQKPKKAI